MVFLKIDDNHCACWSLRFCSSVGLEGLGCSVLVAANAADCGGMGSLALVSGRSWASPVTSCRSPQPAIPCPQAMSGFSSPSSPLSTSFMTASMSCLGKLWPCGPPGGSQRPPRPRKGPEDWCMTEEVAGQVVEANGQGRLGQAITSDVRVHFNSQRLYTFRNRNLNLFFPNLRSRPKAWQRRVISHAL